MQILTQIKMMLLWLGLLLEEPGLPVWHLAGGQPDGWVKLRLSQATQELDKTCVRACSFGECVCVSDPG